MIIFICVAMLTSWIGSTGPASSIDKGVELRVDLIEMNHVRGTSCSDLDQVIFWNWSSRYATHHGQGWALAAHCNIARDANGGCVCKIIKHGRAITVRSKTYHESWTSYDPERTNQQIYPAQHRPRLLGGQVD